MLRGFRVEGLGLSRESALESLKVLSGFGELRDRFQAAAVNPQRYIAGMFRAAFFLSGAQKPSFSKPGFGYRGRGQLQLRSLVLTS